MHLKNWPCCRNSLNPKDNEHFVQHDTSKNTRRGILLQPTWRSKTSTYQPQPTCIGETRRSTLPAQACGTTVCFDIFISPSSSTTSFSFTSLSRSGTYSWTSRSCSTWILRYISEPNHSTRTSQTSYHRECMYTSHSAHMPNLRVCAMKTSQTCEYPPLIKKG